MSLFANLVMSFVIAQKRSVTESNLGVKGQASNRATWESCRYIHHTLLSTFDTFNS